MMGEGRGRCRQTDADALGGMNTDSQRAGVDCLVVTVQFLPRILDLLSPFLRVLPVSRRSFQSLRPRESAEPTRSGEQKKTDAPLYANTCSTRSCRCCILRSICASCQRDRLRGLGRIPCRPLVPGVRDVGIRGLEDEHTEPVGLLWVHVMTKRTDEVRLDTGVAGDRGKNLSGDPR